MADDEILALSQDMTISREEFLRCLPAAVGSVAYEVTGAEIRHREAARGWRITVSALPDLALGAIRLPRQRVQVHLSGYGAAEARRFLDRFELYFRRGGG